MKTTQKLFETIHPNRWFIWTIALIVMIFIVVWGAVERYSIEQEYSNSGDELFYSIRLQKKVLQNKEGLVNNNTCIIQTGQPPVTLKISKDIGFCEEISGEYHLGPISIFSFRTAPKDKNESLENWMLRNGFPVHENTKKEIEINNLKGLQQEFAGDTGFGVEYIFDDVKHQRGIWLEFGYSDTYYVPYQVIDSRIKAVVESIEV